MKIPWRKMLSSVGKWLLRKGGEEVAEVVVKKAKREK